MMKSPLLETQSISINFEGLTALNDVNISVGNESITALIGPNGAGKTTLLNVISGFLSATIGTIRINGKEISGKPPHEIAQLGVIRTFQDVRIIRNATVIENLLLALRSQRLETFFHATFLRKKVAVDSIRLRTQALELLSEVELDLLADSPASSLSYGQAKLLEITRARAMNPALLLLDEPASGLNPVMLDKIRQLLVGMKMQGMGVLLVEHNMPFVFGIADKIIVLDKGSKISEGKAKEVRADRSVISAYLGSKNATSDMNS